VPPNESKTRRAARQSHAAAPPNESTHRRLLSSLVVASLSGVLVTSSPCRPAHPVFSRVLVVLRDGQEVGDLVAGQRDQGELGRRLGLLAGQHGEIGVGEHDQHGPPQRGSSASNPRTIRSAVRRGSTRPNRPAVYPIRSLNNDSARPGSKVWPTATAAFFVDFTNHDE